MMKPLPRQSGSQAVRQSGSTIYFDMHTYIHIYIYIYIYVWWGAVVLVLALPGDITYRRIYIPMLYRG